MKVNHGKLATWSMVTCHIVTCNDKASDLSEAEAECAIVNGQSHWGKNYINMCLTGPLAQGIKSDRDASMYVCDEMFKSKARWISRG